jgi:hypothetical protein
MNLERSYLEDLVPEQRVCVDVDDKLSVYISKQYDEDFMKYVYVVEFKDYTMKFENVDELIYTVWRMSIFQ